LRDRASAISMIKKGGLVDKSKNESVCERKPAPDANRVDPGEVADARPRRS